MDTPQQLWEDQTSLLEDIQGVGISEGTGYSAGGSVNLVSGSNVIGSFVLVIFTC